MPDNLKAMPVEAIDPAQHDFSACILVKCSHFAVLNLKAFIETQKQHSDASLSV